MADSQTTKADAVVAGIRDRAGRGDLDAIIWFLKTPAHERTALVERFMKGLKNAN